LLKALSETATGLRIMDDTDQRLIAELRRDGRAALSDLADRLGLSRATVRSRMERLTEKGEIAGFTVLTRSDVTAAPVRGLIMIGIEGKGGERGAGDANAAGAGRGDLPHSQHRRGGDVGDQSSALHPQGRPQIVRPR
jgi:hypothetical protein